MSTLPPADVLSDAGSPGEPSARDAEYRRVIAELLESEERYRLLVETSPYAIGVHRRGKLLYCNAHALEILRAASAQELEGRELLELVHPEDRAQAAERLQAMLERGAILQPITLRLSALDGTELIAEAISRQVQFQGQPAVQTVLRDITEQQRTEEALRQSEARWRSLLDDLEFVAVQAYDPDGTITFWNKGSEQLYGYAAREALGRDIVELLHGAATRTTEREIMAVALETGELPAAAEVEVLRRDGSRVSILASRILHSRPGQPPEFVCFDVDITARKRAEEELAQRHAELLHAARLSTVGAMVAALTHEVAQPLSAIGNYAAAAATLLQSLEVEPRAKLQEFIDAIQNQTQRCGAILRRLRDFSRRSPPRRLPTRLNQVLGDSVEMIFAELRRSEVSVQFDLAADLPSVHCDRIQIEQVIVNLLTNARDAVKNQPPDRRTIVVRSRREADEAVFEVADCGEGLEEEAAQRLFEPFFTTKADGMGVGLSICKTIVRDHGGRIEALATPGGGATFRVHLPLGKVTAPQES